MARLVELHKAGNSFAVCDVAITECLRKPFLTGDTATESAFRAFFSSVQMLPEERTTWEHAAKLGAKFNFKALDSLHIATAIEHGCGLFLTADTRLAHCTEIPIEVLA